MKLALSVMNDSEENDPAEEGDESYPLEDAMNDKYESMTEMDQPVAVGDVEEYFLL